MFRGCCQYYSLVGKIFPIDIRYPEVDGFNCAKDENEFPSNILSVRLLFEGTEGYITTNNA